MCRLGFKESPDVELALTRKRLFTGGRLPKEKDPRESLATDKPSSSMDSSMLLYDHRVELTKHRTGSHQQA
jgi:hypothetical protein